MKKLLVLALASILVLSSVSIEAKPKKYHKPDRGWAYAKIVIGSLLGVSGARYALVGGCTLPCCCCLDEPTAPCAAIGVGMAFLIPAGLCLQSGMSDLNKLEEINRHKRKKMNHHPTAIHN